MADPRPLLTHLSESEAILAEVITRIGEPCEVTEQPSGDVVLRYADAEYFLPIAGTPTVTRFTNDKGAQSQDQAPEVDDENPGTRPGLFGYER